VDEAVLLLNMGGARNKAELREFLYNMFDDKYILSLPLFLRKIVRFFIVFLRIDSVAKNYESIGYSPIYETSHSLKEKLQKKLPNTLVDFVFRYTTPRAKTVLKTLKEKNIKEVFLFPLYPHFSTTTTKSSIEDIKLTCQKLDYFPKIKEITNFYHEGEYNQIIIKLIKDTLLKSPPGNYHIIFSAHSLPKRVVEKGDSYEKEINEHFNLLKNQLIKNGLNFLSYSLAYQSKLGPVSWLEPSLEEVLKQFNNKNIIVFPLSFTIDNSETLFELHKEYRLIAKDLGIKEYRVCSCPNDSELFVDFIFNYIRRKK